MTGHFWRFLTAALALSLIASIGPQAAVRGEVVTLKNNVRLEGSVGQIAALNQNPMAARPSTESIIFVDDDLRRVFVGFNQLAAAPAAGVGTSLIQIKLPQRVAASGNQIYSVGMPIRVQSFDEHGWRIFTMTGPTGKPLDVVQGMTVVTPVYTKLDALQLQTGPSYVWSTRIATSSIPREQLSRVLKRLAGNDSEKRLNIVRLYIQADRIQDARAELEEIIKDFPELADLKTQVEDLRQAGARLLLKEIELRRDSGQPRLALAMLNGFPKEGVAGETLLRVRDELEKFGELQKQGDKALALLKEHQAALDPKDAASVKAICDEITAELNIHTLDRMADYLRLSDDTATTVDQKLSLAISGWLLGSGAGIDNLSVSKSLVEVRQLVRTYLNSKALGQRKAVLEQLEGLEGSSPERVARIIAHMKPPYEEGAEAPEPALELGGAGPGLLPAPAKKEPAKAAVKPAAASPAAKGRTGRVEARPVAREKSCGPEEAKPADASKEEPAPADAAKTVQIPGLLELTCKGPAEHPLIKYYVQLPPEYDPYRRYPVIVTLNGAGTTPQQQIDWWAGSYNEQSQIRAGQATRHGYIVVAPAWQKDFQRKYEYSLREHACVLNPLRDVLRRFSADSDRVFLSGHSMGGDAVWDIGLAHPDLWAGVVPIVASADKYVRLYWENAAYLPMYFISGEKDGNKLADNAVEWDRYLTKSSATLWDIMVVQYLGRGHEHYHDDIQNLFTWMNLHKRNFFPTSFAARSMRPWDSFFWCVEAEKFPANNMVHPVEWTGVKPPRATPASIKGEIIRSTNNVNVDSSARKVTVWLSPEMVDFDAKLVVSINNKAVKGPFQPNLEHLLEDVRTRGDRQHPFWLKVVGGQL
jgi:pimeloyl-ACP methyl ester carboxylesterase/tetratricopeptide (TPR) repeat protein